MNNNFYEEYPVATNYYNYGYNNYDYNNQNIQSNQNRIYKEKDKKVVKELMPIINHCINESKHLGLEHTMTELALTCYLVGTGINPNQALKMAESYETNEHFM